MANKAALVDQIKSIQRSDPEAKQQWWDYCDQNLGGVKDPNRHDASVLEEFLAAQGSGSLDGGSSPRPQKRRQDSDDGFYGKGGYGGPRGSGYGYGHQQHGYDGGYGYPPMPPPGFDGWGGYPNYGGHWGGGGSATDVGLAEMIKMGQRKSSHWKAAWQAYCIKFGNGFSDPHRYDDPFLVDFLDYIGQLVLQDVGPTPPQVPPMLSEAPIGSGLKRGAPVGSSGAPMPPPAKRQNTGGGDQRRGGYNSGSAYSPAGDIDKAELVDRVKSLQRSDPAAKEAWWSFCDEFQGGIKDPNRHDSSTLLKFLQGHE